MADDLRISTRCRARDGFRRHHAAARGAADHRLRADPVWQKPGYRRRAGPVSMTSQAIPRRYAQVTCSGKAVRNRRCQVIGTMSTRRSFQAGRPVGAQAVSATGLWPADGPLALMIESMRASAIRPQPLLAVRAAPRALDSLMGRKVWTGSDVRSELHMLGLADCDGARTMTARRSRKSSPGRVRVPPNCQQSASGAGPIAARTGQTAAHSQIVAFARYKANVVDRHSAPKQLSELWNLFTELADSAAMTFMGAEDADQFAEPLLPSGGATHRTIIRALSRAMQGVAWIGLEGTSKGVSGTRHAALKRPSS